jgi:hypothetical protein
MIALHPLLLLLLIPAMSWLDRQRGSSKETETITKGMALAGLGLSIAILLGVYDWSAITIVAVTWTAYAYGFGEPLGRIVSGGRTDRKTERWQVGALQDHPYLAMTVRGLLVLPTALAANGMVLLEALLHAPLGAMAMSWADIAKLTVAFGVAFPLAPFIAIKLGRRGDAAWALQEYIRGGLIGALLLIAGAV